MIAAASVATRVFIILFLVGAIAAFVVFKLGFWLEDASDAVKRRQNRP